MSTAAVTPQGKTLAQMIRAKYPGTYDDLDDVALEQKVLAKYPEYGDIPRTQAARPGAVERFGRSMGAAMGAPDPEHTSDFIAGPAYAVQHPVDSAELLYGAASEAQQNLIDKAYTYQHAPGMSNKVKGLAYGIYSALPLVGPTLAHAGEQYGTGDAAGGSGTMAGVAIPALAGKYGPSAIESVRNVKPPLRGVMARTMSELAPGEQFSRQQVLDAARGKGINLDLADATGSGVARGVKAYSERSLGGRSTMRTNTEANLQKLGEWADQELGKYAGQSTPRETLGSQVSAKLMEDLAGKKEAAANAFEDLDRRVGDNNIDGTNTIEAEARNIIAEMKDYYAKHPELKPKQAWSIIENLAERPKINAVNPQATAPGLVDVQGKPVYATGSITKQPASSHNFNWSELHQLRSDLMDAYRNNPDMIKGKSEAWLQRMVSTIDQSMTDSAQSRLSPQDLRQFRQANTLWSDIKSTYDNPQHPYYHAVRPRFESQVLGMLENKTPELARQVRSTIGSLEGPFQRQFAEGLLTDKAGNLDLKNLNSRLSRVPDDFLQSMLGEDGAKNLRLLGKVSQRVTANLNPSGTSDVMVPASEIGAASSLLMSNPPAAAATIGGELATGYGSARALTSPSVVDYLTKPKRSIRGTPPRTDYLAALAGLTGDRRRK
jgi:hypothetical protein